VSTGLIVRPASSTSILELTSKASTSNQYRGYLRVRLSTTVMVVNHVGVDLYLRGVVPAEMPSSWPVEALKAQSIAARSYAINHLHPSTGSFDVYDDTRSQVYRGRRGEQTATNAAIAATAGTVLLRGSTVANALFHSADGGWTENNENVFVSSTGAIVAGPLPYLRGSSDRAPDGSSYDAASPYATWHTATYSLAALSGIFAKDARTNAGTLTAIDLSRRGVSGRLISVTLTGSLGSKIVSGGVFVAAFNAGRPVLDPPLRGTLFATAPIP
jgi:stage II sporulation protein D